MHFFGVCALVAGVCRRVPVIGRRYKICEGGICGTEGKSGMLTTLGYGDQLCRTAIRVIEAVCRKRVTGYFGVKKLRF